MLLHVQVFRLVARWALLSNNFTGATAGSPAESIVQRLWILCLYFTLVLGAQGALKACGLSVATSMGMKYVSKCLSTSLLSPQGASLSAGSADIVAPN